MLRHTGFTFARIPFALLAVLCALGSVQAQTPLHAQYPVGSGTHYFGNRAAAGIGDVDGDGTPDYAIGARRGGSDSGYVVVFSGATGEEMTTLTGNGGPDRFGCSVAGIGDVNGDLVPDLLVGAEVDTFYGVDKGIAMVFSGSDWSVLRTHTGTATGFGANVAALGDANGDGVSEYLAYEGWNGVYCFSGADGVLLWKHQAGYWDAVRGSPVTGDANGDGIADALIGAPIIPSPSTTYPYALVLDGATGSEIHKIFGAPNSFFGSCVSWIGDVNGDQCSEFAIGAPWAPVGGTQLDVFDGASGSKLYGINGNSGLGNFVCGLGDQDGDSVPDFAAEDTGHAKLFSGVDGGLIHTYDTTPMVGYLNATTWLAPAGDLDGDGAQDLLNSTYSLSGLGVGAVVVFSSTTHPLEDLGYALGGSLGDPQLLVEGAMNGGSVLRFELSNTPGYATAFVMIGTSAIHLPFRGGTLVPSPDAFSVMTANASGRLSFSASLPPGVPGQTELYAQFWILDGSGPFGLTASNAVKGVVP